MVAMLVPEWGVKARASSLFLTGRATPCAKGPPGHTKFRMNDDPDEDPESYEGLDDEYGEGGIPADLEADIEERRQQEAEDRQADLQTDSAPRSGGCLLILALPALAAWLLR
jgi:hypothetical protein